ncbi:hypothetical protein JCM3770_002172 [Rhodotorula araucariae]
MASIASLPPELVGHIVRIAAPAWQSEFVGPGWYGRLHVLGPLSLVGPFRHFAQSEMFRVVAIRSVAAANAFLAAIAARKLEVSVDILILHSFEDDLDSEVVDSLLHACPTVRSLMLGSLEDLNLESLAGLSRLEHLTLSACTFTSSPRLVLPRLLTLTLSYTTASRADARGFLSATSLPCLHHLVLAYATQFPDDIDGADPAALVYARPQGDFVRRLVSIEHSDPRLCEEYGTTRGGGQNSLFVVDVRFVPADLAVVARRRGHLYHLRVRTEDACVALSQRAVDASVNDALEALSAGVSGVGEFAECLCTLRTLFLPEELRGHTKVHTLRDRATLGDPAKLKVAFYSEERELVRLEAVGEMTTFMRLSEAQEAAAH